MSKRKRYAAEEIIAKLREAEVHLAQGDTVGQAVRKLGVSEQTGSVRSQTTKGVQRGAPRDRRSLRGGHLRHQ